MNCSLNAVNFFVSSLIWGDLLAIVFIRHRSITRMTSRLSVSFPRGKKVFPRGEGAATCWVHKSRMATKA